MKILRLSLFNLRKNKREAAAIVFLTMVTVFMLSVFLANGSKIKKAFDESFAASGSVNRIVLFKKSVYHDEFRNILERDHKPERLSVNPFIFAGATDVRDEQGEVVSYNFLFATERTERKIERFIKTEALSDDELKKISHPIWLPVNFSISKGHKAGETFTIVKGGRDYPFTIAGFYETGLESSDGYGFKCILPDEDYELFSMLFESESAISYTCTGLCFDASDDFDYYEFLDKCSEASSENLSGASQDISYKNEKANETLFSDIFLMMTAFLSLITMISALFMIRHKISNDIEDQMQQIGVLEALGYRAYEISLAYLYEYVVSAGLGCIFGALAAYLITPGMNAFNESILGRTVSGNSEVLKMLAASLAVFMIVIPFALLKARTVKKYPPVTAFRKGMKTHSFKRNVFPLERAKENINVRLAMKSLASDLRSCIGVAVCMITAGITILFSVVSYDFFKDGTKGLESVMGTDDVMMIDLMDGVDQEKIRDELMAMPEVRKALISYNLNIISVKGSDLSATMQIYDDYRDSENIFPAFGRYPEHDNEVMITYRRANIDNLELGDNIVLEKAGLEKSYVITGIVSSMMNSGSCLYLTSDGYRRIDLNARPTRINVYLNDGFSYDAFEEKLNGIYGISAKDAMAENDPSGSLEDRIRAAAGEKIAVMLSRYGVTSVDYAIRIGDQLITGNSRPFVIKEISTWEGMVKTQLAPISDTFRKYTVVAAILISGIVAVILSIIAASGVRRQRHSLGIMKGLGYSSKDLMTQMALKLMPVILISLIIASFGAVWVNKIFWLAIVGIIAGTNIPVIIVTDIVLMAFCYIVTYLGAGRIRKISVNELMTE
ncbi:MAG: ABC transporter permease [Lachnospiraceae bacterium]|nr:ABC transporter permease [Lachnospiraceae bacterium]